MTIIADYQSYTVEVLDTWETGGVKMASIRALEGKPFVGGDRWPVKTEYTTIKVSDLSFICQESQPEPSAQKTLLDLALEQYRPQWHNGEAVWIWKGERSGAYLKNNGQGEVKLCLTDRRPDCTIFTLGRNGWEVNFMIHTDYRRWLEAVRS